LEKFEAYFFDDDEEALRYSKGVKNKIVGQEYVEDNCRCIPIPPFGRVIDFDIPENYSSNPGNHIKRGGHQTEPSERFEMSQIHVNLKN
jgi:hypothetical protein